MAKHPTRAAARRWVHAAGSLLLGTVGCAFPHGGHEGDPLLGNFNRPIVPTPPVEAGGQGLDSPAYDGGAKIGLPSPDVPTGGSAGSPLTNAFLAGGLRGSPDAMPPVSKRTGAKLPPAGGDALAKASPFNAALPVPTAGAGDGVAPRDNSKLNAFVSGSAIVPDLPGAKPSVTSGKVTQAGFVKAKGPAAIKSVEEGQTVLQQLGAKFQRLEQIETGEWQFSCVVGDNTDGQAVRTYEARGPERLDAIRQAIAQIKLNE